MASSLIFGERDVLGDIVSTTSTSTDLFSFTPRVGSSGAASAFAADFRERFLPAFEREVAAREQLADTVSAAAAAGIEARRAVQRDVARAAAQGAPPGPRGPSAAQRVDDVVALALRGLRLAGIIRGAIDLFRGPPSPPSFPPLPRVPDINIDLSSIFGAPPASPGLPVVGPGGGFASPTVGAGGFPTGAGGVGPVPNTPTFLAPLGQQRGGGLGFGSDFFEGFDFVDVIDTAVTTASSIANIFRGPQQPATPQRSFAMPNVSLDLPFVDVVPQGASCITPTTRTSTRLPSRIDVPIRDAQGNMRVVTYRNMGRPILWSGDAACAKRYAKVTGKTLRRRGGR